MRRACDNQAGDGSPNQVETREKSPSQIRLVQLIGYGLALVLILMGGYMYGLWTNRWSNSNDLKAAIERLRRIPRTVDVWRSEDLTLEEEQRVLESARIDGFVYRQYVNSINGDAVSLLLVCGHPKFISVHTPDICFPGSGYQAKTPPIRVNDVIPGLSPSPTFMREDFDLTAPSGPIETRVYWAWSLGDRWQAPDHPRWAFATKSYLYKMYITCGSRGSSPDDPAITFLRKILPELREALVPDTAHGGTLPTDRRV